MTQNYFEPGDVKLSFLEIASKPTGARMSPYDQLVSASIYEDITQPTMMAEFHFNDSINILGDLPINGEETIKISVNTPGVSPTDYVFDTVKIDGSSVDDNNKGQSYTLKAVSPEHLVNSRVNVRESLKGRIDQGVQTLYGYLNSSKQLYADTCKGECVTLIAFQPPFVGIDMLRRRAVHPTYASSAFVFFENQQGFHFKCMESLIERGQGSVGSRIFNYSNDPASDKTSEQQSYRSIIEYENVSRTDVNRKIASGGLNILTRSYDFLNKEITDTPTTYNSQWGKYKKSDAKSLDQVTSRTIGDHGGEPALTFFIPDDKSRPDTFIPEMLGQRMMYAAHLNEVTLRIMVHGDTSLMVGDTIEINIPEPKGMTGRTEEMKYLSGKYLIKALHHMFNFGTKPKHSISMDCIKVGYSV